MPRFPAPRTRGAWRAGRWSVIVGVVSVALLVLSGCSAAALASPLTESQRGRLRSTIFDTQWAVVSAQYPEALRPAVAVIRTVPDADWVNLVAECLSRSGFITRSDEGGLNYSGSQGQTPIEYAVSSFACYSQYPTVSQTTASLTVSALEALYDYYSGFLRPCLLAAGQPSPPPPARADFVALARARQPTWDPYERVALQLLPGQEARYLELRCRPVPQWLDLAPRLTQR